MTIFFASSSMFDASRRRVAALAAATIGLTAIAVPATSSTAEAEDTAPICAAPSVSYLSDLNTTSAYHEWTLSEGSSVEFTPDGLDIVSTAKAGYMNYEIEPFSVSDVGDAAFDYVRASGDYDIGLNLAYAENGSELSDWSGTLVYEPGVYHAGGWWSTKDNKAGEWREFSLADFAAEFPNAHVLGVGFSLGSTTSGSGTVKSVTAGCTEYRFVDADSVPLGSDLTGSLVDFESASDADSADGGLSGVTITATDASMMAAAGCYFAEAPVVEYNASVFTRYAGYASEFPEGGYTASADFYFDTDAEPGQFAWSHGVNGSDGAFQRDFIFHAGADGAGTWTVGVSNNAANSAPYVAGYGDDPATVTESGWYTLQHRFYREEGLLFAEMALLDAAGASLRTWTLGGHADDIVPDAVGGNRYGWLVNNSYANLPIDNVLLNAERPTAACPAADVTELEAALTAAGELVKENYTPESFARVTAAVEAAAAVEGVNVLQQDEVAAAAAAITAAIDALDFLPAHVDALNAAIKAATGIDRSVRTASSLSSLDAAVAKARALLDADITAQDKVAAATKAVQDAIAGLTYKAADTKALTDVIAQVKKYNLSLYTHDSSERVTTALKGANALLKVDVRSQDAVDTKVRDITSAIKGLVKTRTFSDTATNPYASEISWLAASGITTGYADGTFRPYSDVNRDAMAAFLYRAAGEPRFTAPASSPFIDVPTTHKFYKEIAWLASEGISTGWRVSGGYEFRPYEPISRNAMAAFLYRYAEVDGYRAPAVSPFADIKPGQQFYKEMSWLATEGVSTGWSVRGGKEFRPYVPINRDAMAAFLYRMSTI